MAMSVAAEAAVWVPAIGDKVEVIGKYAADYRGTDLWVAGVRVHDSGEGLDVTLAEQWPVPNRHWRDYRGQTDGWRPENLRLIATTPACVERLALRAIKAVTATAKDGAAGLSRIMSITRSAGVSEPYTELMADPNVALIVSQLRTKWAHLFKPGVNGCALPPDGWQCSRDPGHDGPCAATRVGPSS